MTLWLAPAALSQIRPLRLNVIKTVKKERSEEGEKRLEQKVFYTVEIANASTSPVKDMTINWTILYKKWVGSSQLAILEGERECSLELGQKYVFETADLTVPMTRRQMDYGAVEIVGYLVEIRTGKKIIASDMQPSGIKERILAVKKEMERNRAPGASK
jgi:hypothetical protein